MKSTGMRKIIEILMIALMAWSVFQIRNYIAMQDICEVSETIHWEILMYELLFLASGFGFVAAMEKGIFKKHDKEGQ